nr:hypothetical protein Iba_chr04bCG1870 [Ipomoea batatas]
MWRAVEIFSREAEKKRRALSLKVKESLFVHEEKMKGHSLSSCRWPTVRPREVGVEEASEPENLNVDDFTLTECDVGEQNASVARSENADMLAGLNNDRCTPPVCLNDPACEKEFMQGDGALTGNMDIPIASENAPDQGNLEATIGNEWLPTAPIQMETWAIKQGLEELAQKGMSVEQFVGEAVLEAAVNIIEEAADNVVREEEVESSGSEGESISFDSWVENLKAKVGKDSGLLTLVEEAKQEVENFFDNALKEWGEAGCEEKSVELLQKANGIFLGKIAARGLSVERGLSCELRGVRDKSESEKLQESGGSSKGEVRKKERVFKNTMDWVNMVEECMKRDKLFEQKVEEALKEINAYLWTVYDKEKEEYIEDGRNRAMKAAAIFFVRVEQCPAWGSENGLLGRHLKANIDSVGARICHWAVTLDLCRGLRTEEVRFVEGDEGAANCENVCMRTGEQNVPICDQNVHEAVGNDSVENDPSTEQVQDAEHLRASEMAVSGQNERLEERVVEQGLEETASIVVREEKVNDGKVEMVVTVQGSKKEGEVRQKQSDVGNVESSNSKEEFVTPKKSGGLTKEDFFVQFATAMEAIVKGTFERKGSKGKEGGLGSKNSAQVRGKEVSKGSAKGEVRVFNNTMEWVKVVEEFMKEDKDFDQKVKEALKEVNTYLWTVYDKEKEEYIEEGINRAMRAATIFLVKVKHCPSWGSENGLLGSLLLPRLAVLGGPPPALRVVGDFPARPESLKGVEDLFPEIGGQVNGHSLSSCRWPTVRPREVGVEEASEPENLNVDDFTLTECDVGEQNASVARSENADMLAGLNNDRCTPPVCLNDPACEKEFMQGDGALTGNMDIPIASENAPDQGNLEATIGNEWLPTAPIQMETWAIKQGLEELAQKGMSVEQFVGEAVLEAAVNIIEEAADNVVREEEVESSGSEGESISFDSWVENLKAKVGKDSGLLTLVEEAKQEVENFFDNALKEWGEAGCEEKSVELLQKANGIFLGKIAARGLSVDRGLSCELRGVRDKSESEKLQESGGSSKGEVRKKERVFKNTMDWVNMVEECMKRDKLFEQKVEEALKEINAYLWTVYDKEKEEYIEDGRNRAMKAAAIFFVRVEQCPAWGSENGLLGRHLKANIDSVGARICHWAVTLDLLLLPRLAVLGGPPPALPVVGDFPARPESLKGVEDLFPEIGGQVNGHSLSSCRWPTVRPREVGVEEASEPENLNVDDFTLTECDVGEQNASVARSENADMLAGLNNDRCTPPVCLNDPACEKEFMQGDGALTGNMDIPIASENAPDQGNLEATIGNEWLPTAPIQMETWAIKQGLEELAQKGMSVEQFVGEAVLEAAVNII